MHKAQFKPPSYQSTLCSNSVSMYVHCYLIKLILNRQKFLGCFDSLSRDSMFLINCTCILSPDLNLNRDFILSPDLNRDFILSPDLNRDFILSPDLNRDFILSPDLNRDFILSPDLNRDFILSPDLNRDFILSPD